MPKYDFRCPTCGLEFEVSRPMSQATEPAECPHDASPAERVFTMPWAFVKVDKNFWLQPGAPDAGVVPGAPDSGMPRPRGVRSPDYNNVELPFQVPDTTYAHGPGQETGVPPEPVPDPWHDVGSSAGSDDD